MNREDIIVAIHGQDNGVGGRYNVLASFVHALTQGFRQIGVNAMTTQECVENNKTPNLAIAFNASGLPLWQKILNNNIPNIMWACDSVFYQNLELVQQFSSYQNFILFNSCSDDTKALQHYLPTLVHGYIPGGTDLDFWKKQDVEKDLDITFFGSIDDPDAMIQKLKDTMPDLVFKLMMNFCDVALANPDLSLWHISQIFNKQADIVLDMEQYHLISKSISYIITYKQRIKMIQALKDFNVTIFGEGPWEKFAQGKIKVVSGGDVKDTVNLMNRSKITLNSHPFHLAGGIHDRVLNASAVETMLLCGREKTVNAEFGDTIAYCNPVTYEDIAQKADYFLTHEDERQQKALEASKIVKTKHKWSDRAQSIMDIIDIR